VTLTDDLTKAVSRGTAARVRDLVIAANEKERRSAADEMAQLMMTGYGRGSLASLAFVGTATARNVASWGGLAGEAGGE
jgi:hypothetical protein